MVGCLLDDEGEAYEKHPPTLATMLGDPRLPSLSNQSGGVFYLVGGRGDEPSKQ